MSLKTGSSTNCAKTHTLFLFGLSKHVSFVALQNGRNWGTTGGLSSVHLSFLSHGTSNGSIARGIVTNISNISLKVVTDLWLVSQKKALWQGHSRLTRIILHHKSKQKFWCANVQSNSDGFPTSNNQNLTGSVVQNDDDVVALQTDVSTSPFKNNMSDFKWERYDLTSIYGQSNKYPRTYTTVHRLPCANHIVAICNLSITCAQQPLKLLGIWLLMKWVQITSLSFAISLGH